jgi:hypothetical protein
VLLLLHVVPDVRRVAAPRQQLLANAALVLDRA